MKYKLNCYGWEAEFIVKSLTDEQVSKIENLMLERGTDDLADVSYDLLEEVDIDLMEDTLFHQCKPLDNNLMNFELEDETGKVILKFRIKDTSDIYDMVEDFEDPISFVAIPDLSNKNLYISVEENKGGLYYMEFESDEVPTAKDFACTHCSLDTQDGDWDYIDAIYFKGNPLEVSDYLDNITKGLTVELHKL
jgi:hypothetical protein